jgi:hypothetical protein
VQTLQTEPQQFGCSHQLTGGVASAVLVLFILPLEVSGKKGTLSLATVMELQLFTHLINTLGKLARRLKGSVQQTNSHPLRQILIETMK